MHIWVDADACPAVIKDILFRAAQRWQVPLTLVANQMLRTPPSPLIRAVQVPSGFDVADAYIAKHAVAADLVITGDIPLAAEVLGKGAMALNPRGERYSNETIRERLAVRDMMEELRASGVQTGGPAAFGQSDRKAFANQLDTLLARQARSNNLVGNASKKGGDA
ncbi:YaiI/YqxD family protein [Bordetella genomosp. 13]|uniref:YaiI/YqxD family protein n=1 Tax=Bordetella genomosp. 13 TaxID=463040 RepID=UPI0011AA7D8A|nr:YaiI/YqxD family protein [Bordetella genomosp. 13]